MSASSWALRLLCCCRTTSSRIATWLYPPTSQFLGADPATVAQCDRFGGFLNHPQLSALIDENDEEAFNYMTRLEPFLLDFSSIPKYRWISSQLPVSVSVSLMLALALALQPEPSGLSINRTRAIETTLASAHPFPVSPVVPVHQVHYTSQSVEEFEDIKSGYRIKFHFGENPYFENNLIIKEFHLGTGGKPVSQSTPIKWKKGMDLTALSKGLDEKGRKRGHRSFFSWFTEHRNPTTDEIAEVLKDDMWPNPLQYFLIAESESGENGLDDSDEENGDDSVVIVDEDEDEEEDDEDDDDVQEIVDEDDDDEED
eukprot:g40777.t1